MVFHDISQSSLNKHQGEICMPFSSPGPTLQQYPTHPREPDVLNGRDLSARKSFLQLCNRHPVQVETAQLLEAECFAYLLLHSGKQER